MSDMERSNYQLNSLSKSSMDPDPIRQFQSWLDDALNTDTPEPTAMNLATCNKAGEVSSRIVLLKACDKRGFMFFTNYESLKASDLNDNIHAALCFWWGILERQVRIQGNIERLNEKESDAYYSSRPRGSQIGAIASRQSTVIDGYHVLAGQVEQIEKQYAEEQNIPRPGFWGGYLLRPVSIEFWQGRPSRLHDRLKYKKNADGDWFIERLSP